jgi:hypothetical protein
MAAVGGVDGVLVANTGIPAPLWAGVLVTKIAS